MSRFERFGLSQSYSSTVAISPAMLQTLAIYAQSESFVYLPLVRGSDRADTTPPQVSVTNPADGSVVSGTVQLTANASDDVAVAGVQFLLDGSKLNGEDTAPPYEISWNTVTTPNGLHKITASARDSAGNVTTSDAVNVTVSNNGGGEGNYEFVFVSRQIPTNGSVYYRQGGMLPGTGHYSRFTVAAPGKLIILEPDGSARILVDGSNPTVASLNLIDVSAPDVSYDGKKIVFAGVPDGDYESVPNYVPGVWRIYSINVDGSGLQQITFSDRDDLDLSQFAPGNEFEKYDDTDPAWLPDGRIVFSSSRWPSLAQYNEGRTTQLHVVNADGSNMRRITAERNGADRPLVDPQTGRIVYSRWWRNYRNPANDMSTIEHPFGDGYIMHLGLIMENNSGEGNGPNAHLLRNSWMLASINPDGTELKQFAGISGIGADAFDNQAYGGSFAADGSIYTTFYPMHHISEAAGFGGIRHFPRGAHGYTPIIGIADDGDELLAPGTERVFKGNYAADPEVLPDGRVLISWAPDARQDYGLYTINPDGSDLTPVYDKPGTTEIRARVVRPRPTPPIIPDQASDTASLLPPLTEGPYDIDGTFTFNALNVFFNAPVDMQIVDAMPVGSAATMRSFIDHQRESPYGNPERMHWPILLAETAVNPDGSLVVEAPANVPLFEQMRTAQPGYDVPLTGSTPDGTVGAAHVAGMNFGRPGENQRCVGCHAGHSMIPVPATDEAAKWTNLAPSAKISVSSIDSRIGNDGEGLTDRRVHLGSGDGRYWISNSAQSPTSQWVELTFPVPVTVRAVRLYNVPQGRNQVEVQNATVQLYGDTDTTKQAMAAEASKTSGALSDSGTDVSFADVPTKVVRIEFDSVSGNAAGLAEIEVIARAGAVP